MVVIFIENNKNEFWCYQNEDNFNYHEIEKCLGESKGIDVTGGMKGKINELTYQSMKQKEQKLFICK